MRRRRHFEQQTQSVVMVFVAIEMLFLIDKEHENVKYHPFQLVKCLL